MAETWTIAEAARRCGCPRSTLQRAIRAGRLHCTADHWLTVDALTQAGYFDAAAAQQPHAAGAQQARLDLPTLLRDMQRSMEQLTDMVAAIHAELRQMQQARSSSVLPPGRTQQARSMERQSGPSLANGRK
jgi:hypothetical protein